MTKKKISKNKFTKKQIVESEMYREDRDILSAILKDKSYSHDEVKKILDEYLKRKVTL